MASREDFNGSLIRVMLSLKIKLIIITVVINNCEWQLNPIKIERFINEPDVQTNQKNAIKMVLADCAVINNKRCLLYYKFFNGKYSWKYQILGICIRIFYKVYSKKYRPIKYLFFLLVLSACLRTLPRFILLNLSKQVFIHPLHFYQN